MLAAAAEHAEMRSLARFQSAWTFGSGGASRADRVTAAVHAIVEIYAVPEMRCIYELEAAALTDANLAAEILRVSASIDAFVVEAARRLAPGGPVEDSFDDMVRLVVDCARGVAQRTALETPSRAKTARRRTAELLAGLLVG
jgi:hypothetical protein